MGGEAEGVTAEEQVSTEEAAGEWESRGREEPILGLEREEKERETGWGRRRENSRKKT